MRMAVNEAAARMLRERFVDREAIYIYKGVALRVRVMNIQLTDDLITVEYEEVPTAGFEFQWLRSQLCLEDQQVSPLRWHIGVGAEVACSNHEWHITYGCSMYFAANIIQDVVDLAARWSSDLSSVERYNAVCGYLIDRAD